MGGNRVAKWRWQFNLFFTFLISGLWHGANWTFVIWGALNGFYLLFSIWTRGPRDWVARVTRLDRIGTVRRVIGVVTVFALICFAWIFFRAETLGDALYVVKHLFTGWQAQAGYFTGAFSRMGVTNFDWVVLLLAIGFMEFVHLWQRNREERHLFSGAPAPVRWLAWYGLVLGILLAGVFSSNQFIYFQF